MTTTAVDVLTKARELIEDERHWIKGAYIETNDDGEDCFCSLGAKEEALRQLGASVHFGELSSAATLYLYGALDSQWPFYGVADFNDRLSTTHADVLALFDRAIASAKGESA